MLLLGQLNIIEAYIMYGTDTKGKYITIPKYIDSLITCIGIKLKYRLNK